MCPPLQLVLGPGLGPELEMGLWEAIKIPGGQHCRAFTQQGCVLPKRGGTKEPCVLRKGHVRTQWAGSFPRQEDGSNQKPWPPRPREPILVLELGLK